MQLNLIKRKQALSRRKQREKRNERVENMIESELGMKNAALRLLAIRRNERAIIPSQLLRLWRSVTEWRWRTVVIRQRRRERSHRYV